MSNKVTVYQSPRWHLIYEPLCLLCLLYAMTTIRRHFYEEDLDFNVQRCVVLHLSSTSCHSNESLWTYHLKMKQKKARHMPVLSLSRQLRLKRRTKLHTREIRQMHKRFCKVFPGGTANLDQFTEVYEAFFPGSQVSAFSELVFRNIDADSNGNVTFEEYLCAFMTINRGSPDQKINWMFDLYDRDKDDIITTQEFLNLLQAMYGLLGIQDTERPYLGQMSPEDHVKAFFQRLDRDNDGSINRDEFYHGVLVDPTIMQILKLVRFI